MLGCSYKARSLAEFFDNSARQFATLTALASHAKLCSNVSKVISAFPAKISNLVVSNLSTNAYVHVFLRYEYLNANENDCQHHLYLLI